MTRVVISHLCAAGAAAVLSWVGCEMSHRIQVDAVAATVIEADQSKPQASEIFPEANRFRPKQGSILENDGPVSGGLKLLENGSAMVPRELLSRLHFYPLNADLSANVKEMEMMGFSELEARKIEDLMQELSLSAIDKESKKYSVVSQNESEVTLKIPSDPSNEQSQLVGIKEQLNSIVGEKAELLEASIYETLSHLTAGFGENDRIVHLQHQEDGQSIYEIMELLPESTATLAGANAPISDYRRVALQTIKFRSPKVPERLQHLFKN